MADSPLLTCLRQELRLRHYSPATERAYVGWVVRYVRFHQLRHPLDLTRNDLLSFLAALAVEHGVSASTQNQALAAVNFLYREVLQRPLDEVDGIVRAKRPVRLPVVLTKAEVRVVLGSDARHSETSGDALVWLRASRTRESSSENQGR